MNSFYVGAKRILAALCFELKNDTILEIVGTSKPISSVLNTANWQKRVNDGFHASFPNTMYANAEVAVKCYFYNQRLPYAIHVKKMLIAESLSVFYSVLKFVNNIVRDELD